MLVTQIKNKTQLLKLYKTKQFYLYFYRMGYICLRYFLKLHYFLVHKMGLIKLSTFPQISNISYRSVTRFKRFNKNERPKKHLMFNLYFLTRIHWIKMFIDLNGVKSVMTKPIRGWCLNIDNTSNTSIDLISSYNFLLYKLLYEGSRISFYRVKHNWGHLQPFYWNTLKLQMPQLWTKGYYNPQHFVKKYWSLVNQRKHLMQYRIDIKHIPVINQIFKSVLRTKTLPFFKVMFLRMHKYPVLFKYSEMEMLVTLSQYGWKRGRLPLNKLYQKGMLEADPSALRVQLLLDSLFNIYLEGDIHTELHMFRALRATVTTKLNLGLMVRADLMFAQPVAIANKLVNRWKSF